VFSGVASGAKAYLLPGAIGFSANGGSWNGLIVVAGSFAVTYNSNGGSAIASGIFLRGGNVVAAPSAPTRSGYTFKGWSDTNGGTAITFPYTPGVNEDITLYSSWVRNLAKAVATVKPTVTGTTKIGKVLTVKSGTWSGYPTPAISQQWYSCSKAVTAATSTVPSTCKKISGETKSTLKISTSHKGKYLAVLVTGKGTGTTPTLWLTKSTTKVG
jgi:uncharacterized repeat protein (TIGR02543 family)